ncbi:Zinc finger protein [Trichinella pseudospiralis]|uniref:Zinc finger protein n=1 Tax=Trichinella pseudospiralis TaxID=6337 RepID=A0A0V1FNM7_TRIPS|nr:Zinc finger protein [Trichinella pseudospiralis]
MQQLKSSVQKEIRKKLLELYPSIEPYMDQILPKKEPFRLLKCHDRVEILIGPNGDLLFFKSRDGSFIPTLRLLHQYPFLLPWQQVDKGAIRFVLSGANVMCPGLTSKGAKLTPDIEKKSVVAIMAEGKQHAMAIGEMKMSSEEILKVMLLSLSFDISFVLVKHCSSRADDQRCSISEANVDEVNNIPTYPIQNFVLEEPFSESEDELAERAKHRISLPVPKRRIRTLSGTIPPVGYSPIWGGPTMCLMCLEFFDLPKDTSLYAKHLLKLHKIVITEMDLIVDLKRYVEYWRQRFGEKDISSIFPLVLANQSDSLNGEVDNYYLMSPSVAEDRQLREKLALRRLEEVLQCQQRERVDTTFCRQCLFCRYTVHGNRSQLIHHLYLIHRLNLGSPDNMGKDVNVCFPYEINDYERECCYFTVFVTEYIDILSDMIRRNQCLYCEEYFADNRALMEHMRIMQHREVNPKNVLYDKFYVINYLELGKKWLEVLAEDFEDTLATFADSDEEAEEESWNEWEEEDVEDEQTYVCLLCDKSFQEVPLLLQHMLKQHHFHFSEFLENEQMDFYERIKFVNFIRKKCHDFVCFICGKDDLRSSDALKKHLSEKSEEQMKQLPGREKWNKEEYLQPTYENDLLLTVLDEIGGFVDGPVEEVHPEDLPDIYDSILNDPEIKEDLQ